MISFVQDMLAGGEGVTRELGVGRGSRHCQARNQTLSRCQLQQSCMQVLCYQKPYAWAPQADSPPKSTIRHDLIKLGHFEDDTLFRHIGHERTQFAFTIQISPSLTTPWEGRTSIGDACDEWNGNGI
jgi:hypothetical protein